MAVGICLLTGDLQLIPKKPLNLFTTYKYQPIYNI